MMGYSLTSKVPPYSFSSSMMILSNRQNTHRHNRRRRNNRLYCLRFILGAVGIVAMAVAIWSIRISTTFSVPTTNTSGFHDNHDTNNDHRRIEQQKQKQKQKRRKRAVFYNIYVPPPPTTNTSSTAATDAAAAVDNALRIIKEQLLFIRSSELLKSSTIYYTLIGTNKYHKRVQKSDRTSTTSTQTTGIVSSVDDEIQTICQDNDLNCIQSQYVSKGSEMVTLQSMWEYCISESSSSNNNNHNDDREDDDRLVTYIHSKGSFHPSTLNDNFRIMAMTAVTSDECQSIPQQSQQTQQQQQQRSCNVCTGRFTPFPHFHPTGNFFVATCDYIKQLIPPKEFEQRMEDMMKFVLFGGQQQQQPQTTRASSMPIIPKPTFQQYHNGYSVGTERFANEHWVSSYLPTFDPCDVVPLRQYRVGYKNLPPAMEPFITTDEEEGQGIQQILKRNEQLWTPSLVSAPRFDLKTFMKGTADRGSWFCGQARLFEYTYLYRQYYRSKVTGSSSSNGTSMSNDNSIIDPPPVSANSFIWDYYHEAFKGCPEPLNYTKHVRLFMQQL